MDFSSLLLIVAASGGATSLLMAMRGRSVANPALSAVALIFGGWGLYLDAPAPWIVALAMAGWSLGILLPARLLAAARSAAGRGDLAAAARWASRLLWIRRRPADVTRRDLYRAANAWWRGDAAQFEAFRVQVASDPKQQGALPSLWALTGQWSLLTNGYAPLSLQVRAHCELGQVETGVELAGRLWPKAPSVLAARNARSASLAPLAFAGDEGGVRALLKGLRPPPPVADLWRATAAWAAGDPEAAQGRLAPWRADPTLPKPLRAVINRRLAEPPTPPSLGAPAKAVLQSLAREVHAGALLQMRGRAPLTALLLLSLVAVFGYQSWLGTTPETLYRLGALFITGHGELVIDHTALTYGWLHGNTTHLLVNTMGLLAMGPIIERAYGWWGAALLYFTSVLGAAAVILLFGSPGFTIGASGAVMGWLAAVLVTLRLHPKTRGTRTARVATGLVLVVLVLQLVWELGQAEVSSAGHLGGLLTGGVVAWLITKRR